jgi:apolipoprotein N-acyltransferase
VREVARARVAATVEAQPSKEAALPRPASGAATLHRDDKPADVKTGPGRKNWRATGRNFPWRAVGFGALGGLSLYAAFPPVGWWPIAIPAVTVITLACRGRGWRVGLLVGLAAGLAEFVPLIFWLHVVTPLAWIVLAVAQSLYLAALGAGLALLVGRLPGWQVWTACLWVGEELIRIRWPLGGFGWGRLAFSQANTPFTGYAALGGAPLVTFAVALCAALLASAALDAVRVVRAKKAWTAAAAFALAALVVPLVSSLIPRPENGRPIQVAAVQGNVAHPGKHFLGRAEQVLDNHLAETAKLAADIKSGVLAQPQIVLWPENASDVDPLNDPSVYAKIQAATRSVSAPILVGAVLDAGPDHVTNTGIVWSPTSGPGERYSKRHLVPFGEYIPWRGFVSHLTSLTSLVPQNFLPGHTPGTLDIGPTRIADVMCFEVAFADAVRSGVTNGGRIIVVQTNNATYMGTAETEQQLAMSQLRAVEHGRSVVVASTSGISAVIAPDGHVVTRTGELTPAIIDLPVVERAQLTIADHLGAAPEWTLGILGALAVIAALVIPLAAGRSARRTKENSPAHDR